MSLFSNEDRWRIRREFHAYRANVFVKQRPSAPVLIFAQGRTGSTLLESLLESTGHFVGKDEILGALNEKVVCPIAYVKGLARSTPARNIICHVKIYQLTKDRADHGARPVDPAAFLQALHADGWHIIALRRCNKFDHYISGCLARQRGGYHKSDDRDEELRLVIDRAALEKGIRNRDAEEALALQGVPHIALEYESDLATAERQQASIARLLNAYGLEPRLATTKLKKIANRPASEFIANYAQARAWADQLGEA